MTIPKEAKKHWFRNKSYGWGWYPASVEGWAVLGVFFVFVFVWSGAFAPKNGENIFVFLAGMGAAVGGLILLCLATGEKPEWRWAGKPIFKKK